MGLPREVRKPDGSKVPLQRDADRFDETDQRGVYSLLEDGSTTHYAVNLSPAESRTSPLAVEELESRGARLGVEPVVSTERLQELRDFEIEGSQKLWRWLVLAALLVLIAETWLAGRRATRTATNESTGTESPTEEAAIT